MRADNEEVRAYANSLYAELQKRGIEVIYDDRNVSAGFMFSDADLLGVPYRVIVSPRNIKQGVVEVSTRDKSLKTTISMETAADEVAKMVADALQASQNV
jgi:prolyl-tRNA synthetase